MKFHTYTVSLLMVAIGFGTVAGGPIYAADNPAGVPQQTSSVSGRVKNLVTGQYLNKARIAVKGTDLITLTDEFGEYRLVNIPPGVITLEVFYTDLDEQEIQLE